MAREIRLPPSNKHPDDNITVLPDFVPQDPPLSGPLSHKEPLVLYIYRVPGRRDVFLTKYKCPEEGPTELDINRCLYYLRYDDLGSSGPGTGSNQKAPVSSQRTHNPHSTFSTRNLSQLPLSEQGLHPQHSTKLTLVAVDLDKEDIREVATMLDPQFGRSHNEPEAFGGRSRSNSAPFNFNREEDPMFMDVHTDAYRSFGLDVGYTSRTKAFTRRLFKARPTHARSTAQSHHNKNQQQGIPYTFTTPWATPISLHRSSAFKDALKAHHLPRNPIADADLVSELRPNFSPAPIPSAGARTDAGYGQDSGEEKGWNSSPQRHLSLNSSASHHLSPETGSLTSNWNNSNSEVVRRIRRKIPLHGRNRSDSSSFTPLRSRDPNLIVSDGNGTGGSRPVGNLERQGLSRRDSSDDRGIHGCDRPDEGGERRRCERPGEVYESHGSDRPSAANSSGGTGTQTPHTRPAAGSKFVEDLSDDAPQPLNSDNAALNPSAPSLLPSASPYPSFNLAQERLGGGRGDDAKLGKLILYPHGQAFVDLLVAANLLVFNRIYQYAMRQI